MAHAKYLIIGGGVASAKAAVSIRARDADGHVILASREDRYPYDRPPLSKNFLTNDSMTAEDPESKDPSWYVANNVEIRRGATATHVDPSAHRVDFADGQSVSYDKLLLSTGASPIRPRIEGAELDNVFCLRTVDDAENIRAAIKRGGSAVMIGGGYIGLEVAASAASRGVECTIIDKHMRPWSTFASHGAGDFVRRRFEAQGVTFLFDAEVARIIGGCAAQAVATGSGKECAADFVVIGVGVKLNTELARDSGIELDHVGAIVVDQYLRTSEADIYAAGDVAAFPDKFTGKRGHLEHYMNGSWQGEAAGSNMAGQPTPYDRVGYFYSDMFDIHMALRGAPGGTFARTFGAMESGNFVDVYAGTGGRVQMGLAVSQDESKLDPISDKLEALIVAGETVDCLDPADFAAIA